MRYLTKKSYHIEEESEGSWAISYGDMITLLLSFFVIFFTTDAHKEKAEKLNNYMSFSMEELKDIPKDFQNNKFEGLDVQVHQTRDRVIITFGEFSFFDFGRTKIRNEGVKVLERFVEKFLPYAGTYSLSIKGFTDSKRVRRVRGVRYQDNLELSALRSVSAMRVLQKAGIPLDRMEIAGAGEMNLMSQHLPKIEISSDKQRDAYSRTIIIVISPEKESWL